jgi:hypothetical protein
LATAIATFPVARPFKTVLASVQTGRPDNSRRSVGVAEQIGSLRERCEKRLGEES